MVESLQTITHSRPATRPMPVMMPAAWMCSPYMPLAASGDNSRNGAPASMQRHYALARQKLAAREWRSRASRRPALGGFGAALSSSATSARIAA